MRQKGFIEMKLERSARLGQTLGIVFLLAGIIMGLFGLVVIGEDEIIGRIAFLAIATIIFLY